MDCIIFHIDFVTIQLSDGMAIFTKYDKDTDEEQHIEVPLDQLIKSLSTASMLRKS